MPSRQSPELNFDAFHVNLNNNNRGFSTDNSYAVNNPAKKFKFFRKKTKQEHSNGRRHIDKKYFENKEVPLKLKSKFESACPNGAPDPAAQKLTPQSQDVSGKCIQNINNALGKAEKPGRVPNPRSQVENSRTNVFMKQSAANGKSKNLLMTHLSN